MADNIDSVIAAGTNGNNMQQLGSIMSLGNQAQQLKNAQLANQQGQITLQNSQATQQADQARAMAESESAQQHAQQEKLQTLQQHVTNGAKQMLSLHGTGASPDQVAKVVTDTMTNAGANQDAINQALSQIPTDKSQIDNFIVNKSQSALSLADQINSKFPASNIIDNGQVKVPVAGGNQALTGVAPGTINGPATQNQISPSERSQVGFTPAGQPIANNKDVNGNVTGITSVPVNGHTTEPFIMPANENADTLKYVQGLRQNANVAASNVPQTQAFANNAIRYSSGATTGTGAAFINNLKGQYAGTPWTASGATETNLMGHALSQLTGSLIQSSGLSTNQGQSLVANQVANNEWTKSSIQTASREVRALSTGANLFNQGMENTIAKVSATQGQGAGQFAARDFQNAWSKAADVNAYKLYDAIKNKNADPEGLKNIITQLGGPTPKNPNGSIIYQQTLTSIDKMKMLLNGGK